MKLPNRLLTGLLLGVLPLATAACGSSNTSTPTTPSVICTVTAATPSATSFGEAGGSGTVVVTAGSTCSWTSVSGASFITVAAAGAAGTGNATVSFTVAANTGAARSGTLTVAGTAFTISQSAAGGSTTVTLSAPVAKSPSGGQTLDASVTRPTLTVTNAVATGSAGTVTYRFEISDQPTFPVDAARTFSVDGIAQGSGSTSGVVPRDLGPSVLWYWHGRATNGSVTSAYSNTETFQTPSLCSFALTPTTIAANPGGGTSTVTVTTTSACAWTAVSNASFITVTAGASGTGNGAVTIAIAPGTGVVRTGTVTIGGQTVTVTQQVAGVVAGFNMVDPGQGPGVTTTCQIRSLTSTPTTCTLQSTSFPLGTSAIASYAWVVSYTYPSAKNLTQVGANPNFAFTDTCGQTGSTDSGFEVFLSVTLTVTDTDGNAVTVRSDTPAQPQLKLRAYICGI